MKQRILTLLLCLVAVFATASAQEKGAYDEATMGEIVVEMETAAWGQNEPYNNLCPTVGTTPTKTGCGPTAFAILCHYYKWPESGSGSVTHNSETLDLSTHTYDYENMLLSYSGTYNEAQATAVATLMRDLGYAAKVTYGTSGTDFSESITALKNYFSFNNSLFNAPSAGQNSLYRSDAGDESFKQQLKECLSQGYPVLFSSISYNPEKDTNNGRHIFIVDGYTQNDYFHFNFGWGGNGNGWYDLDNVRPDNSSDYSTGQRAYLYVIPNAETYPVRATVNDSNMGTVSINGGTPGSEATASLFNGVTATLTAHPVDGYALANWKKGGEIVGTSNTLQISVGTSDNDYVANFDDEANVTVIKDYVVNVNSGTGLTIDKINEWAFNTNNDYPAALRLASTTASINTNNARDCIQLYLVGKESEIFTLSVPEDYVITEYTIRCKTSGTSNSTYITSIAAEGQTYTPTKNYANYTFTKNIQARSAANSSELTIVGEANRALMIEAITVTVAKEGANVGGGSTPTTCAVTTTSNPAAGGTAKFAVGTGSEQTEGDVENGTQITLYATANTGYNFVNWTLGGNVVSTDATCNLSVAQDANYVANFEENATPTPTEYPTPTGATYENNYLTSVTTTGANENISYTANAHPGAKLVTLPGIVRVEQGKSFTVNLVAKSLSSSTSSVYEDMRYCHASLFTDFDGDHTFGAAVQTWGSKNPSNNIAGNYSSVMNITREITVPADAPLGTSHVRMIYTNAWKEWPTNGTTTLDKGIVYDIVVEVVEPSNEKTLNVTFGELWSAGDASQIVTKDSPAITITEVNGANKIGYSTKNDGKHPFLLKGGQFTISVPAPYKIASYTLVAEYVSFNAGTVEYTNGIESTTTATISNGAPSTLSATGLNNSEISIELGDALASPAGLIITSLEITYVEDADLETYTVAVTAGENGTATASAETVTEGGNVTLTATANTDYKFVGWYNGETKVSEANPYTFAVTSNISYEARFEELFPDGAYKIYWQADNRGYLAYHATDYPYEAKLADVTLDNWDGSHYNSSTDPVDLVWYLITASDGKRYLFEVATGKFLGVDTSIQANGTGNKLSTTEAWAIAVEPNTNSTRLGHYIITTMISGTKNLLCSGCGTSSFNNGHPVRWLVVNDTNQKDGGAPLQLIPVNDVTVSDDVMNAVRAVIEPRTFKFQAEVEGWRNDNPNTHLGTITIGGTPLKLTPEHLTASELTMALNEGTTLAFTRKYRGFEFNGFYIGATSLGTNPTLTADNVAAIDENNPLIAKFTATDDVTLFYDDDEFSYRIPAIAKTGTNRLVAVSDYRHSHDDIGRDNHGTGTLRVDLVMRTSDDNGLTWSEKQTIAEGNQDFGYGDAAIVANGQNILVMAVAGNVFFTNATSSNKQRTYRIYSSDNGATWNEEEVSSNLYSLFPNANGMFFGSGKLVVDPNFNNSGNARVYGAVLLNDGNNYVVYSDNWGSTWNILGGGAAASANEPKVEILPNGQILLSSRRNGGRTFNVFTYTDKANNAGTWSTATNGCDNGGNGTNGEIILLDAKRPNGTDTKILLQSQPYGSDRRNVSIWYKEISADETYTGTSIASNWTMGKQVSTQLSAYSAMTLQENGEIALFFEEAPCYGDDHTKGYSMVYVPLTIEEITNNAFLNPNAEVEPTTVNVTLTDEQGNTYTHQFDYLPGDAAAIDAALMSAYPFITELGEGNLQGSGTAYTYTNTVTLPFKVSNANTTVWHNIYWPANDTSPGKYYPIYLLSTGENDTYVAKKTETKHYGESSYNTLNWADELSWAVYSVDGTLNFKFKNKLTGKFMAVNGVVSSGSTNNVIYTDEANATTFTLEKYTGTNTYYGNYAIKSVYNGTTGYVCNTSAGHPNATNYTRTDHAGAWAKFVEAPDYQAIVDALEANVAKFGTGDGKYTDNDDINAIKDIIEGIATTPLNTLNTHTETVQNVKESYREVVLTVNDDETATVPGSVSITVNGSAAETVNNKFVPANATVSILATANPGYRFVNWTRPVAEPQASAAARTVAARNSNVVSDQNPYTVTVSEALSLEANFEEIVVNATLTDAQGNTYEVQVSGFTTEITKDAVAEKLREAYPYIKLGATDQEGNVIDFGVLNIDGTTYTYTNKVRLPFLVSNASDIWHNIYWPSNTKAYDYPVYLSASTADDVYVPKVTGSYAYGDHPTYNTKSGNDNISWAIYNVNNGFEFIFKNKVTKKYIRVRNVASKDAQNVQYVENAEDATAFTIEMKPEGETYDTDAKYALAAEANSEIGYLCSTSATGYDYATHYNSNEHQGAWIEFKESPDYFSKIMDLGIMLGYKFGAGDGKYIITDAISEIDDRIANNSESITLNTIKQDSTVLNSAMNSWPAIGLTVEPAEGGTTNINGEENVVHKYVPNDYALPLVAVPAEGYHFVSWTDGTSEIEDAEYTKTISGGKGDVIELTATFAKYIYNINVTAGEGGSATASAVTAEHGSEVTLTAEENNGYRFSGWYNGEEFVSSDAEYTFTVTSDINYTARFNEVSTGTVAIHITVASTDGTTVTNTEEGNVKAVFDGFSGTWQTDYDYADGEEVKLLAVNDHNSQAYLFDGWYKDGELVSNDLETTVKATEAATYQARFYRGCVVEGQHEDTRFGRVYNITRPDGTTLGYDAAKRAVVAKNTQVKINTDNVFYGYTATWTDENGDVVDDGNDDPNSLVVTVTEDVIYNVTFAPATYTLTVSVNDDSYGTVSATSDISTGTNIKVGHNMEATITATAKPGYRFVEWTTIDGDHISYENPHTVPAIQNVEDMVDVEYVAVFEEKEYASAGKYYRIAYDFEAPAANSAPSRSVATRAAGETITISATTGELSGTVVNNKYPTWTSTENGQFSLTASASAMNVNSGLLQLFARIDGANVTYTLNVGNDYVITEYTILYKKGSRTHNFTISADGVEPQTPGSTTAEQTFAVSGLSANKATFSLSGANGQEFIKIQSFTVTIQEAGAGAGGDGGETPEPTTEKYYIQSTPVSGTNNAMVMTTDTAAASVFYYADSKLMSYANGKFVKEDGGTRGLQAYGAENAGVVTITENGDGTATIAAPSYLHAYVDGTTYYVNHCGGTATCTEHNFILEEVTSLPVTISAVGYATFYAPVAVKVPAGVNAWYLADGGIRKGTDINYASMTQIKGGVIPANTGVILGAENAGTYYFDITEYTGEDIVSLLDGTVAAEYVKEEAYVLSAKNGIGFYKATMKDITSGTDTYKAFLNNSHKSYLPASVVETALQGSAGFRLVFGTTAIEEVEAESEAEGIYDLSGRKLEGIYSPGVYIVNGKKVLVK